MYVVPTNGMTHLGPATSLGAGWGVFDVVLLSPDLTGDGKADLLARFAADGSTQIRPGDGNGGFGPPTSSFNSLAGHDLVTVAGDLDGDGHADLVARDPATGRLDAYLGNGQSGFTVKPLGTDWGKYNLVNGPGDVNGDGRADLVARGTEGAFYLVPGAAAGVGFGDPVRIGGTWTGYDTITGHGDFNGDGKVDLLVRAAGVEPGLRQAQPRQRPVRARARPGRRHRWGDRAERRRLGVRRHRARPARAQRRHPRALPQRRDVRDRDADRVRRRACRRRDRSSARATGTATARPT